MRGKLVPTCIKCLPSILVVPFTTAPHHPMHHDKMRMGSKPTAPALKTALYSSSCPLGAFPFALWHWLSAYQEQPPNCGEDNSLWDETLTSRSKDYSGYTLFPSCFQRDRPKVHRFVFESQSCETEEPIALEPSGGQHSNTCLHWLPLLPGLHPILLTPASPGFYCLVKCST